ncbi:hypothetical protein GXM_07399 [Nostoc sphaeroides CCNUC1]|uniref:Uncharacterized protein n=1 Tax=Nostoc sphaeroides CCNUC1 TaxID=2653204 RepID=A0A5P8WAT8_9NOSO|nr:hypothetical protein GXM_07399 [Nostoc sphaeroides CCNUC1]
MFIKVTTNYEVTKPTINKSNPTAQKISALVCRVFLVVAKKSIYPGISRHKNPFKGETRNALTTMYS